APGDPAVGDALDDRAGPRRRAAGDHVDRPVRDPGDAAADGDGGRDLRQRRRDHAAAAGPGGAHERPVHGRRAHPEGGRPAAQCGERRPDAEDDGGCGRGRHRHRRGDRRRRGGRQDRHRAMGGGPHGPLLVRGVRTAGGPEDRGGGRGRGGRIRLAHRGADRPGRDGGGDPAMRTEPGLVIEGRYELTSLIATGGMGQVWKGRDQELDREVAVKVLREAYAGGEGVLKRLRAAARHSAAAPHTAALSHHGIAALYGYGELDGRAYIVMELCPGRPLSDLIEENPGGLPEKRVVTLLIELARALDAAHSKGVVHRDVKPENVLVDEKNDWAMKITDFGIARSKDQARLTKTGLVMGTAQYLSPEQAMGKQATSLSDIYALGIVGYEMLNGRRPFTGSSQV